MKKAKRIAKYSLLAVLIIVVGYYLSLVVVFNINISQDYNLQRERLALLRETPNAAVNEADFMNFDLASNESLRLNDIQVLATHNSYKTMPNMYISKPLLWIAGERVRNGHYEMPYLTTQLDNGIRGLELDITKYGDEFILMHDPITDWRTNGSDFVLALEEINIWMDNNPNHIPIHIMLQVRSSWTIFSPKFGKVRQGDLLMMDDILSNAFGDERIIKPSDVIGEQDITLKQAVEDNGWPLLSDCLGKIYFTILFDGDTTEQEYVNIDPTFKTQKSFIFTRPHEDNKDYAAIILSDGPFNDRLPELINGNYIVRSRIDVQYGYALERHRQAIEVGAQILATDYPEGHKYDDPYICRLTEDNKTIILRGSVTFDN